MKLFGTNKAIFTNHIKRSEPYIEPLFVTIHQNYTFSDSDIKTIQNFLEKDSPVMEFNEIRAIVKMQYAIYKQLMIPKYVLDLNSKKGKNNNA